MVLFTRIFQLQCAKQSVGIIVLFYCLLVFTNGKSWLLKEAKFGRLPLLETTISSLLSDHSEERYLELLDSFNGVAETYHLASLTVSPGVKRIT